MFQSLKIAKYRFTLKAGEKGLDLPPFKASTFRGGFGHVFRSITCAFPGKNCSDCSIQHSCPYIYVFETKPPEDSEIIKNFENVPRPYIISADFDSKTHYAPNETFTIDLFIIGEGLRYVPFFIHSFVLLGDSGIGKQRKSYTVHRVEVVDMLDGTSYQVYDGKTKKITHREVFLTGQSLLDKAAKIHAKSVTISFETPLRVKWNGSYTSDPQFHILLRNSVRRLSNLLYFHHEGERLSIDFSDLFQKAEQIELLEKNVKWVDWERYSSRQDTRMSLGGIMGEVSYKGDLAPFIPWLVAAEIFRIGKQTAFGLGRIQIAWA